MCVNTVARSNTENNTTISIYLATKFLSSLCSNFRWAASCSDRKQLIGKKGKARFTMNCTILLLFGQRTSKQASLLEPSIPSPPSPTHKSQIPAENPITWTKLCRYPLLRLVVTCERKFKINQSHTADSLDVFVTNFSARKEKSEEIPQLH